MSIQMFPLIGGAGKGMSAKWAESGAAAATAYAEYALKVTVRTGTTTGARRSAVVEFGCIGATQDACDLKAGDIAQAIENSSKGVITSFVKKMGKYRQDEIGTAIPTGATQYGVLTWTNGYLEGQTIPSGSSAPDKEVKGQIFVPFVDVDSMAGSALSDLTTLIQNSDLARAAFENDDRDSLIIGRSKNRSAVKILDYSASTYGQLSSNDTVAGITDGVLGSATA